MNKQQLEKQIEQSTTEREAITDKLIELKQQLLDILLAEAEKPKLGHGDFGYTADGYARIAVRSAEKHELIQAGQLSMPVRGCQNKMINPVFGNIFDLLKEWSEDLEMWTSNLSISKAKKIKMRIINGNIHFGTLADGAEYELEDIEEIWHKLGQMIFALKRRSPQE